ncbi:isoprenyl transferase [Atopobium fossor]|uniref:isoprenyl transferase n=1 Tax=Atopobium fossor TaxID=39487 RepID=UPI0003FBCB48|nr:isoprenyl transferase [Atopobium fossor]
MVPDLAKLQEHYAVAPSDISLADINLEHVPRHISIIMDGNGRWARAQGLDRSQGHKAGVACLKEIITSCVRLGVDVLSAYAFSTENWRRPQHEVDLLMQLFAHTLVKELHLFTEENVKLVFLGDLTVLPKKTRETFELGLERTKNNTGMILALAVNYGSRAELTRATRLIAQEVAAGSLDIEKIDETVLSNYLYTASLPDPELLIRTSGELRISNFLLWQLAYTEFYVTDTFWPDFDRWELARALVSFQTRDRRFGGVKS